MIFRDKLPFIIITVIILFCTTYLLSEKTPFNGDEFYTLDIDKIHKPIPYKFILAKYIERFEAISSTNIFHLRITSIFFTIIGIILCFITFAQGRNEAIILALLLITNSFINAISIYY